MFQDLLLENLREKMGGVYGVNSIATLHTNPCEESFCGFNFKCALSKVDTLTAEAFKIIAQLKRGDVDVALLNKAKQQLLNQLEVSKQSNSYWVTLLRYYEVTLGGEVSDPLAVKQRNIENISIDEIK